MTGGRRLSLLALSSLLLTLECTKLEGLTCLTCSFVDAPLNLPFSPFSPSPPNPPTPAPPLTQLHRLCRSSVNIKTHIHRSPLAKHLVFFPSPCVSSFLWPCAKGTVPLPQPTTTGPGRSSSYVPCPYPLLWIPTGPRLSFLFFGSTVSFHVRTHRSKTPSPPTPPPTAPPSCPTFSTVVRRDVRLRRPL